MGVIMVSMNEFKARQKVVLSGDIYKAKDDYCCDVCGLALPIRSDHYSIGIIDRFHRQKISMHCCIECGESIIFLNGPEWFNEYLFNERFVEDEPNKSVYTR